MRLRGGRAAKSLAFAACLGACFPAAVSAQEPAGPPPTIPPQVPPPSQPGGPSAPGQTPPTIPPSPDDAGGRQSPATLPPDVVRVESLGEIETFGESGIRARDVVIGLGEYTLSGELVEGDMQGELVFSGNPKLTYRGQTLSGDSIRFHTRTRRYSVENLRTALTPEFLQGRILTPLYLQSDEIRGRHRDKSFGFNLDATTCILPENPHYLFRVQELEVDPGKRAILRRVTFYLFGRRIVTLPTLVVPLDRRPRQIRTSHLPQVGRSEEEGFFAKSTFDTYFADRIPGLLRLDVMQKKGIGIGADQAWQFVKSAGALAFYAIPTSGFTNNISGRINQRQDIGGGQTLTADASMQKNSYQALPETTNITSRFGYNRVTDLLTTSFDLSRNSTNSTTTFLDATGNRIASTYSTKSLTSHFNQAVRFSRSAQANFNADYSRYASISPGFGGAAGLSQVNQQLNTRLLADQRADNYLLQLEANKSVPIGSSEQSFFSGVEKLPELTLSNYRFTRGWLSKVPATFLVSSGRYAEGGSNFGGSGPTEVETERVVAGVDLANTRFSLTRSTELNVSGSFQQYLYGLENAAQYVMRNNTTLTQRWGRRSGFNVNYSYQRPEGGTPFRFDQQGNYHALNGDIGFLDDRRLQFTARVGYNLAGASFGGFNAPWQTLSANLLVRPVDWARFRSLYTFDPNTGKFISATGDLRLRGPNQTSFDLVGRYDPQRKKFGQVNGFFNIPIGRNWRVISLFQYNGYLSKFESRNVQVTHDWDCLQASLTYIDNPFGFRSEKQVFFTLRIKGLPFFDRFGVGGLGQAMDTSIGEVY